MKQSRPDIANIIERTLHIKTAFSSGTAFAIDLAGNQYLVTAKHVVIMNADSVLPGETIRLYNDIGQLVVAQVVLNVASPGDPDQGGVDVAVLKLSQLLNFNGNSPNTIRPEDLFITQCVAMPSAEHWNAFGASFGITTRTGTIAKIIKPENRGKATGDFLVGMEAYQGLSGSPIICYDEEGKIGLAGVAARLSWRPIQVFGPGPVHTGFIGCFHIQHALTLIQNVS